MAANAVGPGPISNAQNLAVPPGRLPTYSGSSTRAAEPHHATLATTVVNTPRGRASTW